MSTPKFSCKVTTHNQVANILKLEKDVVGTEQLCQHDIASVTQLTIIVDDEGDEFDAFINNLHTTVSGSIGVILHTIGDRPPESYIVAAAVAAIKNVVPWVAVKRSDGFFVVVTSFAKHFPKGSAFSFPVGLVFSF